MKKKDALCFGGVAGRDIICNLFKVEPIIKFQKVP